MAFDKDVKAGLPDKVAFERGAAGAGGGGSARYGCLGSCVLRWGAVGSHCGCS